MPLFTGLIKRKGIFGIEIPRKKRISKGDQHKTQRGTYIVEQIVSRGTYLQNFQ